ncbi:hypothetical protein K3495_g1517 [Podosphaera aphanis]|nr:hypothetical protein K3495_g1517 [Podosphaera aphanis]
MSPNLKKIGAPLYALHKKYKLKSVKTDLFLGMNINKKNDVELSQGQDARRLLERHKMEQCKPENSPMERLTEPNDAQCSKQDQTEYKPIIGGLQYLANNTRPNFAFAESF